MRTQLINARILTPQGWIPNGSLLMDGHRIIGITEDCSPVSDARTVDLKGMYALPGGIDIHIHGGGDHDFMECTETAFRTITETHMRHGTTSLFPTLASSPVALIEKAAELCTRLMQEEHSPILGLHLEGPYLNKAMTGGQMEEYIQLPDPADYIALAGKWTCIKRWDAAPEIDGAKDFGRHITAQGIVAGIAHTQADYEEIQAAQQAGFSHATHFYNAMTGVHKQREYKKEGTIESIYLHDDIMVELIADGIHVPPTLLRLVHKIKGPHRICLVTDAMSCTGANSNRTFDPRFIIEDGVCKLADRSALAGSVATMDVLIRTMVQKAGIPLDEVMQMAAGTPARIMGVAHRKGTLETGKDADILVMNEELQVHGVWSMGKQKV